MDAEAAKTGSARLNEFMCAWTVLRLLDAKQDRSSRSDCRKKMRG
jgi:hypothetical protein